MHAIARDTEAFPKPCVYIQLDEGSVGMGPEDDEEEDEEEESAELRLVPAGDSEGERPIQPSLQHTTAALEVQSSNCVWQAAALNCHTRGMNLPSMHGTCFL